MTLLVRDEMDILRENVEFHLRHGVDFLVITDNGSSDGTREYLAGLQRDGIAHVIDEPEQNYAQAVWVTRMAQIARDQDGAEWILHNGADEFWVPTSDDLKTELKSLAGNVLSCPRWNMLPEREVLARPDYRFYLNRLKVVVPLKDDCVTGCEQRSMFLWGASPKVLTRAEGLLRVAQGNHSATMDSARVGRSTNIQILHFPVRSYEQFERKVLNGGASYARNTELAQNVGWHWRRWYRLWQQGKLREEFIRLLPAGEPLAELLRDGRIIVDDSFQKVFREPTPAFVDAQGIAIYTSDFYSMHNPWRQEYETIAELLADKLQFDSVLDLGCGNGFLIDSLQRRGRSVRGLEGSANALVQAPETIRSSISLCDLRLPAYIGRFDLVICTEVAEHLEEHYADTLVDSICRSARNHVFFTGATPEQTGGIGHINLQPHEYWIEKFRQRGFDLRSDLTGSMRRHLRHSLKAIVWFPNNALLFQKRSRSGEQGSLQAGLEAAEPSHLPALRPVLAWSPLNDQTQSWLNAFADALAELRCHLILLTGDAPRPGKTRFETISVPFSLLDYPTRYPQLGSILPGASRLAHDLAARARSWWGKEHEALDKYEQAVNVASGLFSTLLRELDPVCVLPWGSSLPQSVLLRHLAELRHIPCFTIERGLLGGTLMVDQRGHGAFSDLQASFAAHSAISSDPANLEFYERAQVFYLHTDVHKYPQPGRTGVQAFRAAYVPQGCKAVVLFGQWDVASGLLPAAANDAQVQAPFAASTAEALLRLQECLQGRPDVKLLFKPHPCNRVDYSAILGPDTVVIQDCHLDDILEVADVAVCQLSTVQFAALLRNKPCLLLGRSQLWGQGIAYEATNAATLATQMAAALDRDEFVARSQRARQWLGGVLRHFLVATAPDVPAGRSVSDLARFVATNALPARLGATLVERQNAFQRIVRNKPLATTIPDSAPVQHLARLIAFYLPQFHPIPENDSWWGKGFTEWTNVVKASSRFEGHYQPHLPGELGFYDLRLPEARVAQAQLARAYGIEAFCYWHYWFNGRQLLERPFEQVLDSGQPDFGFCLAWANENWTRRWDGQESEMLLQQTYGGEQDDRAHFQYLLPAFRDPRAFRIDGKPVFLIYRPAILPNLAATLRLWRQLAAEAGLPGLYLIGMKTCFDGRKSSWTSVGFDAELYFQPDFSDALLEKAQVLSSTRDRVIRYADAWPWMSRAALASNAVSNGFACVVPSWDNSARRKQKAVIFRESSPAEYGRWLREEIARVQDRPAQRQLVFINAWNEWAEGNHLEPDLKWERAYLEETRRANERPLAPQQTNEILQRAEALMKAKAEGQALALLRSHVQRTPSNVALRLGFGAMLLRQEDKSGALVEFSEASRLDPANVVAAKFLASTFIDLGRVSDATTLLQNILKVAPADSELRDALAACLAHEAEDDSAEPACQNDLSRTPVDLQATPVSVSDTGASVAGKNAADSAALRYPDAPKVSIVIPVLNKIAFTRKCLKALKRNTPEGLYEVIVWDNGSSDETSGVLKEESAKDKTVRYYRSEENLGFVGGNNAAVAHARGEFLVFLNNDTEPQPGWLQALLQTVETDPSVGAVGAKLIYPNGKLQEAGGIIFSDASGWNYGRTRDPRDPRFNFPREVDYCSAACLLVRAALFRQLGGFDVRYAPAYYEDTDLCFALRRLGHRVVYQPRCEIIHHEGVTAGQDLAKGFKQFQVENRVKFRQKWRQALTQQAAPDSLLVRRASHRLRGQRILVIDPLMPMYDRASGSKRLFEMLKLLTHGGHAVTFVARNGHGGDRYAAELQALGIEVYAGDRDRMRECGFASNCWPLDLKQLLRETQYDLIILSFWYLAEQYLPRIRAWSPQSWVAIDTVDVHFLRERRQAELYRDQKLLQQAEETYRRELDIYRQADSLITVTEDDRQALLKEIPQSRIFVVPNIHDIAKDVPPVDCRSGCLFIGSFTHPPNKDAVLYFHREVWPQVLQRVPNARWTIVGNNPPPAVMSLAGPAIEVTGYVPATTPYLRSHLVSVAPLRYGAGMKGKIGEALAHGLPVVTTPIGAEGMKLHDGDGGTLVADTPKAFADHVVRLYQDRTLWNHLSEQGRQHIASHFTPECINRQLSAVLDWSASFTSIIILSHNQWEHTERCLSSIKQCTPELHEIIVVDNGSTDKTPEALLELASREPHLRVILNRENRGFAAGNNQGLALARGRSIILLNNDTVVTPGWVSRMAAVLNRHPGTGLVGPMSNSVSGPQLVQSVSYKALDELPMFAAQWAGEHKGQSVETNRLAGFCLLARREVIERIGGLDEQFGSGNFEDDDFGLRAKLSGFELRIAQDVFIHHAGGQTFKGAGIDYSRAMLRNWGLFCSKWALPKDAISEFRYPVPTELPKGGAVRVPLPSLEATHLASGRYWSQKGASVLPATVKRDTPAVARLGDLSEARALRSKRSFSAAWQATLNALRTRPFHPEAYLLLGEIAWSVGDGQDAKACAEYARLIAPAFKGAKRFLNQRLKGNARPEWLVLPEVVQNPPLASRNALSVCLITKNEEQFLPQCLASVRGLAQQIIVVDTGSTDRTVELAKAQGAEVYDFAWCDDFSAARNAALEHATGDWVLMLDADEELPADQHARLQPDLKNPKVLACRLPLVDRGREAEGCSYVPRLFRNAPGPIIRGGSTNRSFRACCRSVRLGGWDRAWARRSCSTTAMPKRSSRPATRRPGIWRCCAGPSRKAPPTPTLS